MGPSHLFFYRVHTSLESLFFLDYKSCMFCFAKIYLSSLLYSRDSLFLFLFVAPCVANIAICYLVPDGKSCGHDTSCQKVQQQRQGHTCGIVGRNAGLISCLRCVQISSTILRKIVTFYAKITAGLIGFPLSRVVSKG